MEERKIIGRYDYIERDGGILLRSDRLDKIAAVDTLILDIDGVLVDVTGSFRAVVSETIQKYFEKHLGFSGSSRLIRPEESGLFKIAGGFNSDWDLSYAAALFYLWKAAKAGADDLDLIRDYAPGLEEFTGKLKEMGGGLGSAEAYCRDRSDASEWERILERYDPDLIFEIFNEIYWGYDVWLKTRGREPRFIGKEPGFWEREKVLFEKGGAPQGIKNVGILTGRSQEEADWIFRRIPLAQSVPAELVINQDMGIKKPDPEGLRILAERMNASIGLYVGDTMDDLHTVLNFNGLKDRGDVIFLFAAVMTGSHFGIGIEDFKKKGADIIAPDIGKVMELLEKRG